MVIKKQILKSFRNYRSREINFSDGINFITGNNGSGKSNILESISITSNLKSFRGSADPDIIQWGSNSYYCQSVVENDAERVFEVGCAEINNKYHKKAKIDGFEVRKSSAYFGKLLTVIFTPDDIDIINGPPELRRRFFDSLISRIKPDYLEKLIDLKRILLSRNRLLRKLKESGKFDSDELSVWDDMFSSCAELIVKQRTGFIKEFSPLFGNSYNSISGGEYSPFVEYSSELMELSKDEIIIRLKNSRFRDISRCATTIGPQRDDYKLFVETGKSVISFFSQGQKRSACISLKISEKKIIEMTTGKKAVILVDDIFSELDNTRRHHLIDLLRYGNQVIFTMIDSSSIDDFKNSEVKRFHIVNNGELIEK